MNQVSLSKDWPKQGSASGGDLCAPELAGPKAPAKPLSLFAAMRVMKDNPLLTIPQVAYEKPVWEAKSIFGTQLFVSDPAGVKRVLLDNVANYPKAKLDARILSTAFGDGLLTSEGEKWKAHRRVMSPSFDFRSLASYAPAIAGAAGARLQAWDARAPGTELDIAAEMVTLTLEIISRTMFSADSDTLGETMDQSLRQGMGELAFGLQHIAPVIGPFFLNRKLARIRANFEALDGVMQKLIRAREKSGGAPKDLLDRLIAATDSETGFKMTDEEVRDEVIIIFLAGHETSALAATYVWYLLSLHPDVEAKLHAELDHVLGGRSPAFEDIEKLKYTRMVLDETLRLYPPAPMLTGRVALDPDEICGRAIEKGAEVAILPWILHRHRTLWEDPDRFDPERFSPEKNAARPRFAYLPFGGGPRICIGAQMALTEVTLLIAAMAQRYRLKLVPEQDIVLLHRITQRPRDGIRMILERRD
ncbi:MAG: cytochrome P450 [Rhizomicrobium sp.]|jgi:cytochrome P450